MSYQFSQQVAVAQPLDTAPPLVARELDAWNHALPGARLNGALLNWYDGRRGHYIGRHADDEWQLRASVPIVSLSFGQARRFRFTHKSADWASREKVVLELEDGDALVMGGEMQRTHKHEVMKLRTKDPLGRRINLTLRSFHMPHGKAKSTEHASPQSEAKRKRPRRS